LIGSEGNHEQPFIGLIVRLNFRIITIKIKEIVARHT